MPEEIYEGQVEKSGPEVLHLSVALLASQFNAGHNTFFFFKRGLLLQEERKVLYERPEWAGRSYLFPRSFLCLLIIFT